MSEQVQYTPEVIAAAQKILAKREKAAETSRQNVRENYPWADADTHRFNEELRRYEVDVKCVECGTIHARACQDLKQTAGFCPDCKKERDKQKNAEKKALVAQAMKMIADGKVSLPAEDEAEEIEEEESE